MNTRLQYNLLSLKLGVYKLWPLVPLQWLLQALTKTNKTDLYWLLYQNNKKKELVLAVSCYFYSIRKYVNTSTTL